MTKNYEKEKYELKISILKHFTSYPIVFNKNRHMYYITDFLKPTFFSYWKIR